MSSHETQLQKIRVGDLLVEYGAHYFLVLQIDEDGIQCPGSVDMLDVRCLIHFDTDLITEFDTNDLVEWTTFFEDDFFYGSVVNIGQGLSNELQ